MGLLASPGLFYEVCFLSFEVRHFDHRAFAFIFFVFSGNINPVFRLPPFLLGNQFQSNVGSFEGEVAHIYLFPELKASAKWRPLGHS